MGESLTLWLRYLPIAMTALVLLGWALIQILQTRREDYDILTVCIIAVGIGTSIYIASIGIDLLGDHVTADAGWMRGYYDGLLVVMGIAAGIGIVPTWRNALRAWRARRSQGVT